MELSAVLVLGSNKNRELIEQLLDIGFAPVVRETMQAALSALRRESFAAILVDRDRMSVDPLEFILNVRDIDEQTPVMVVGQSPDEQNVQMVQAQPRALILTRSEAVCKLAKGLEQ